MRDSQNAFVNSAYFTDDDKTERMVKSFINRKSLIFKPEQ